MMDYKTENVTQKKVRNGCAYYQVHWSEHTIVNRYRIAREVPARAGIFELSYKDEKGGSLKPFYMERVWLGGLRAEIRRASDPAEVTDPLRRGVLNNKKCYYRYTIVESKEDMLDLLNGYSSRLLPERKPPADSGRYEKIFIGE